MYIRAVTGDSNFNGFYVPWWAEENNRSIDAIYTAIVHTFFSEPVNDAPKVTAREGK